MPNPNYTNVNNDFFKEWSPELAYVVGFFIADGNISDHPKEPRYYIKMRCVDKDVLEKITFVSGYKNKVLPLNNEKIHGISFAGKFIWEFFDNLGFDNNKSYTAKIPKQIPKKFMRHCIRGIFDGDGSLSFRRKSKTLYPYMNIVGSEKIIIEVGKLCSYYNNLKPYKNIWRIDYNGQNAINFLNWIYKDTTIHMDRKYKSYLESLKWKNLCKRWSCEEEQLLKELYPVTYAKDLINIFDRSISGIMSKARKLNIKRNYSNGKI